MIAALIIILFIGLLIAVVVVRKEDDQDGDSSQVASPDLQMTMKGPRRPGPMPPIALVDLSCPYCGVVQNPPPERRRKCADCGEVIHIRSDYETRKRYLLTADAAQRMDKQKRDARWQELAKEAETAMRSGQLQIVAQVHRQQASILQAEGRHEYAHRTVTEAFRCDLLGKQQAGIETVEVLTCRDERVCDYCRALEGRTFTIDEALSTMPLPGPNCDDGSCRCTYVAVIL